MCAALNFIVFIKAGPTVITSRLGVTLSSIKVRKLKRQSRENVFLIYHKCSFDMGYRHDDYYVICDSVFIFLHELPRKTLNGAQKITC